MATSKVSNIVQDKEGYLWFGTLDGLFRYDGYRFRPYQSVGNNQVTKLYTWNDDKLLVQLRGEHYRLFDRQSGGFDTLTAEEQQRMTQMLAPPSLTDIPDNLHRFCKRAFWDDKHNTVIDDGAGNLRWIDRRTGNVTLMHVYPQQLLKQGNKPYYSVVSDEQRHLLWISTSGNGLLVYDRQTKTLQHFGRSSLRQTGIDTDLFTSLSIDCDGNLWVCKDNAPPACITVIPRGVCQLSLITDNTNERDCEVKTLRSIGQGMLLVGNNNGRIFLTKTEWSPKAMAELNGIDLIAACRHQQTGDLLLGARRHGIRIGGKWYTHTDNPASLSYQRVNDILTDQSGRIWIAAFSGGLDLAVPDAIGGYSFRHFFTESRQLQTGRRLAEDTEGRIWYGTGSGLFSFKPDSLLDNEQAFRYYTLNSRSVVEIHDLLLDSRKQLWVCTSGQGVFVVNTETDSIRQLQTRDGLVCDATQSAVEDEQGNVWIGTVNGLSCYHNNERFFSNYSFATSSRGNFFSESAAVCIEGQLFFGTLDGVLRITPPIVPTARRSVSVTDVLANGESQGNRLPHDVGMVTFCFSNFGFAAHESSRYTYWLEGYDRKWNQPTTKSEASYRHLPSGEYTFHVKLYEDMDREQGEATITLTILPPWWRTWWAYLFYIIAAVALGFAIFRQIRTMARLRLSLRVERQLTEYKLRFFTNISHEFRTPLTLIQGSMERLQSMEGEVPSQLKQPLGAMNRSALRLLRLINQLLEFRKMQNDRLELHVQETDVVAFVRDVVNNFRDAADSKGIMLQYLPFVHSHTLYIDHDHVDKMVYNLMSNALKYTPRGGSITVNLRLNDSLDEPSAERARFTISVADTGVGIPKEKQPELFSRFMQSTMLGGSIGIGLNLTWELARVHHGAVRFEENPQGGSIFTIELPADKNVYKEREFLVVRQEIATNNTQEGSKWLSDYQALPPIPMNNCRVLVVDDDNDVLQYVKTELQPYFQIETANDGQEAWEKMKSDDFSTPNYQLLISDVRMPRMNGYQLTQRIRQDERLSQLPVILLTAAAGEEQEAKAIGKGADVYLPKPFSPQTLINYCRRLLDRTLTKLPKGEKSPAESGCDSSSFPLGRSGGATIITDERDHHFMKKLDAWIDLHLKDSTSTEEMAAAMEVGRTTLFDKLRQLTGLSPARYAQGRKMARAQQLLREGNMTTKEIAYSLGFDDPHYFSIRFKALFGVTPTEFAKGQQPRL